MHTCRQTHTHTSWAILSGNKNCWAISGQICLWSHQLHPAEMERPRGNEVQCRVVFQCSPFEILFSKSRFKSVSVLSFPGIHGAFWYFSLRFSWDCAVCPALIFQKLSSGWTKGHLKFGKIFCPRETANRSTGVFRHEIYFFFFTSASCLQGMRHIYKFT